MTDRAETLGFQRPPWYQSIIDFREEGGLPGLLKRRRNQTLADYPEATEELAGLLPGMQNILEGDKPLATAGSTPYTGSLVGRYGRGGEGKGQESGRGSIGSMIEDEKPFRGIIGGIASDYEIEFKKNMDLAISRLSGMNQSFGIMIQERMDEISGAFPGYSDELKESNIRGGKSAIQAETLEQLGGVGESLASRGISGGGQLSSAAAQLQGAAIRSGAELTTREQNLQQTSLERQAYMQEQLKNQLTQIGANFEQNVGLAEAELRASSTINPEIMANLASMAESYEIGIEQFDILANLDQEAIAAMTPTDFEILWDTISQGAFAMNMPLVGIGASLVPPVINLLDDYGSTSLGGRA